MKHLLPLLLLLACGGERQTDQTKPAERSVVPAEALSDCEEFAVLLSAAEVAGDMGETESWVLANYKINLWEKPSSAGFQGRSVGRVIPGSHCRIVTKSGTDYKVVSPLDKSTGWISSAQVGGTTKKNPATFEPCS